MKSSVIAPWDLAGISERQTLKHELAERTKELRCLYEIANISGAPDINLYQRFEEIVNLLPGSLYYPEIACARITINDREFKTENYGQTSCQMSADILVQGARAGVVEVGYLETRPEKDEGPFSKEERLLVEAVAERLGTIAEHRQSEEALKESEEFSTGLLENSLNPIVVLNPDTSIRYVNPAFEELTGFTSAEAVGRKAPFPWWPEEKREEFTALLIEDMASGGRKTLERIGQKKNGEPFWATLCAVAVRHNGTLKYFLVNWFDITERKQAEEALQESEEKLRRIFESATEGIVITDLDGTIVNINEAVLSMYGYDNKDELIGRKGSMLVAEKDRARILESRQKLLHEGTGKTSEFKGLRKDGTEFDVEANGPSSGIRQASPWDLSSPTAISPSANSPKSCSRQFPIIHHWASIFFRTTGYEYTNPQFRLPATAKKNYWTGTS